MSKGEIAKIIEQFKGNLMTVKNYALREGVTPQYIYKLEKQGRMAFLEIDGVYFVELDRFDSLPVANRR